MPLDQLHMNPPTRFANALRPVFTEKVQGWLNLGKSINIFAESGQGLPRLAENLQAACPDDARFVRINMKSCAASYAEFLQALADGLDCQKADGQDIRSMVNNALDTMPKKLWLCLEHFDRLADAQVEGKNVDTSGYDIYFLNYLNSLSNNTRVSLLVCSQLAVVAQELYIGGKRVSGSRLEFSERCQLPKLTFTEIEAALFRRMSDSVDKTAIFKKKPPFFSALIAAISDHAETADFAEFIADQPIRADWTMAKFDALLASWKRAFDQQSRPTIDRRLGSWEKWSRRCIDRVDRALGIGRLWRRASLRVKIAVLAATPAALAVWHYWEYCYTYISSLFQK